uniref:CENPB protein Homeodomainlike putative n=1 Tax=Albugo laibachii Nc14 TaxID=890382 RepID=F0WTM9_9STRA|nr:CENPB protein Homeodomainlike putative [Albugo laibachii Nc14]|eukprot:CCA24721.1 CENPB protein Homeodomainlike putative [Albugo laibachii Nc14]
MSTRVSMTHAPKEQLRAYFEAHSDLTQHKLAAWAKVTFKLAVTPSRNMIYRVLNTPSIVTVRNTKHTVSTSKLEQRLLLWIRQCEDYKLPIITGATIQAKAAKIRCDLVIGGNSNDTVKLQALVFSHEWLFKNSRSITRRGGRIALKEITLGYEKRDVFNMDETAFFYCSMRVKSITKDRITGRKHQEKRLMVALCYNADGTTKLPLLFVGSGKKPRCFQEDIAEQHGLPMKAQKKNG